MAQEPEGAPKSAWPWWMDPYSDNPIAFGVLFGMLLCLMIGGLVAYRFLFIHDVGAQPTRPPSDVPNLARTLTSRLLS